MRLKNQMEFGTLPDFEIADPRYVFRGLTYGQWVGVWLNNLLSEKPDIVYHEGKSMAFLRGNVEYSYDQQVDPKRRVWSLMTREQKIKIREDTAVFIPVICTMFSLGDTYQGEVFNDELSMRNYARRDTVNGGKIAVEIRKKPSNNPGKLVDDLNDYYIETPLFPLSVPQASAYRSTVESPVEPGPYLSVVAGVFVIISSLKKGIYRLSFYGRGVGKYLTRSVYDIEVTEGEAKLPDVSGIRVFERERSVMDFVANWDDDDATR
jgi:hypothetical protein